MTTRTNENGSQEEKTQGVMRWAQQMIISLLLGGVILLLSAGTLAWFPGWAYLGLNALTQIISALVLIPHRPDMLAERSQVREGTKGWDRFLAPAIVLVGSFAIIITAGLDARFGWSSQMDIMVTALALILAFACQMFVLWAMASNPFFSTTVRIQADRSHTVTSSGPYRLVRHPGYLGSILYTLVCPLVLASWWAYIPALLTVGLIIVRTGLEDRTLQNELEGYRKFQKIVQYRLIPGVW